MSEYVLEARGIVKTFPGVRALDGVHLRVRPGETHAVVGENGAGKTTLMLTLTGVHRPDEGTILLDGQPVTFSSPQEAVRHGISIVFQELSLVPSLSVAENVFANRQPVRRWGHIDFKELHRRTRELLSLFDLSGLDPATPVRQLGPATQQVVEILKALSTEPKVLILDEPTSSLTDLEARRLFDNLRRLTARGLACLYISHHLTEIFEIAQTVTVLRDGRFVCDARVADIDEDFLVSNMVGRTITDAYGKRPERSSFGPVRFEARGLCGDGFSDVSFRVRAGEIVGFSGLVGAGRTELARAIFGADRLRSGELHLDGKPIAPHSPHDAIQLGIGYLTEDRKTQGLYLDFPVRANVAANRLEQLSRGPLVSDALVDAAAEKAIRDYRIASAGGDRPVRTLSGGNQQKVLIGAWIGITPRLLIADEPTRGVDVGARSEIYGFLRALAAQGTAIVVISSDLPEILGLSDRIYVMKSGVVAGELDTAAATEEAVIGLATGASGAASLPPNGATETPAEVH
ncbi:MAG TPA: sugar ABC transporter ATP-binding protein [Myxococcaceae bacterium]|nr:sugar ABC transporter ATP-binding protein [Myxococcaceae bacterium]